MAKNKSLYNFISKPDDNLLCSICLEVCTIPKQCEDCGKLFCSDCINKNGVKPCPTCRKENPSYFKDVKSGREIKELMVRCTNEERSCSWTGTIGNLDDHVSNCQFALVPCPNSCMGKEGTGKLQLIKKDLDDHLKTECPNRPYKCLHCEETGTYSNITIDHDKVCKKKVVPCPNMKDGCWLSMEREKIDKHISSCMYAKVACCYENLGCGVRRLRKDIKKHEEKDDKAHLHLVLKSFSLFKEDRKILSEGGSMVFKLSGYKNKKENNTKFYSKPFYTRSDGYKMQIVIDANGRNDGAGTHVSFGTELLQGCYDDQLQWPFQETVVLTLLNQLADDKHYGYRAVYLARDNMHVGSGILGCARFFPHSSLPHNPVTNTQYLLEDTLYFKVSIEVSNHKSWLVCTDCVEQDSSRMIKNNVVNEVPVTFKVTGYNTRKTAGNYFDSSPFYTNPGGYKMHVQVCPGGVLSGSSTHLSVYTILSKGDYDADLSWPFIGSVTYTLLNQLANDNHFIKTIEYTQNDNFCPTTGMGYLEFISNSELSYNPVQNTQYLKDDNLYFRVEVTVADQKPWLICTLQK